MPYISWSNYGNKELFNKDKDQYLRIPYAIFLKPDITPALISLIEYYKWSRIYYIYNYDQGIFNFRIFFNKIE